MRFRPAALLLSGAIFLAASAPAYAIEPAAAADALGAALSKGSKSKASYDSAAADGGNVVLSGFALTRDEDTIRFDQVLIETPAEGEAGVFESPRITFTGGTVSGEANGTVAEAFLTDVVVLSPDEVQPSGLAAGMVFATADASGIAVSRPDGPGQMTVDSIHVEAANFVDSIAQDSKGTVEGITIPPEFFADAATTPAAIGYDKLVLGLSWDGTQDLAAKTMTIRDFTLSLAEGGDLSVEGVVGNLPDPRVFNDAGAPSEASKMSIHALTLSYADNSLAGRVLDYLAQQQGISREDYANQMAAALPFLLAMMNNPEFQNEVAGALGAFLKDPRGLTVTLQPASPVTGEEIMGILGSAPQTLPDRLNASIVANSAN